MSEESRFAFGKNWETFLSQINEERIAAAQKSLLQMLQKDTLTGQTILDIGSGSGLFSLAAFRLGAQVVSFDYDSDSVQCTQKLREKYSDNSPNWTVLQGSVLNTEFMDSLGKFDGVYSWGVLHHTGDMEAAIENAANRVKNTGWLFIAIYNDQGGASKRWLKVKQLYNNLPKLLRPGFALTIALCHEAKFALFRIMRGNNPLPRLTKVQTDRGMKMWIDWVDWVGGLPFEVATPEQIINPLREKGFILDLVKTVGSGWGCNEFVFHQDSQKTTIK